jgi:hypothetical protein
VSVVAVRRVLEHSYATGTDRLVLVVLAEHADKETWTCFPSVAIIAKEANVKERAAQGALHALQEAGEIDVEIHGAPYPKTRQQYRPNLYRVTVDASASGAPSDTTSADPVVHDSAPSGARERYPVVHGGAPKSSLQPSRNRHRRDESEATVPASTYREQDDDDLFEKVLSVEAARRTDARIAQGALLASKRTVYRETVARNLQHEEGDAIHEAITANPGASALELVELVWPATSDGQREYDVPVLPFTNAPCFAAIGRDDGALDWTPEADAPAEDDSASVTAPDVAELEVLKAAAMDPPNDESSNVVQLDPRRQADKATRGRARAGNGRLRRLYAASNAAGLDRAEIIAATAQLIGRPIDTLKALTNDEADAVLAAFASKEIR